MDSQLTLIEPPAADAVLLFDTPNFRNFALHERGRGGAPVYVVRTSKDFSRTEICDGSQNTVAVIENRTFLPDQVSFAGRKPLRISAWLKPSTIFPMVFEWQGGRYSWKADQSKRLAVYVEGAALSDPIAWYEHARAEEVDESGQPTVLAPSRLSLRGVATDPTVRNAVLASFLIVIQRSRMSFQHYRSSAGVGTALLGENVLGEH